MSEEYERCRDCPQPEECEAKGCHQLQLWREEMIREEEQERYRECYESQ